MPRCYVCCSKNIEELLDLGLQPIANRFLASQWHEEQMYPMVMNQCRDCGLIQINEPVPAEDLRPQYDWVTYTEPEDHLDHLVQVIKTLPGITSKSNFCGISWKDDSTLARLERLGFSKIRRLDPQVDLNIVQSNFGIETIQSHLTPETASKISKRLGKFDVVITRHILEHAHDVAGFIEALKNLAQNGGYIIFEVPDCSRALETYDYSTVWEEHNLYFTPLTFQHSLVRLGFSTYRYKCYPYPFENSLVGIVQDQKNEVNPGFPGEALESECLRGRVFAENLSMLAEKMQRLLCEYRNKQEKVALFGAGHLACAFVNLLGIKDYIDFFVDDNPHKRGLFMPGCRLPICESAAQRRENVRLCLLSLNPLSEGKVLQTHQDWRGTFLSIFPSSPLALRIPESLGVPEESKCL